MDSPRAGTCDTPPYLLPLPAREKTGFSGRGRTSGPAIPGIR
ncbi:hypothetical protein [Methanoregula sp. UBA64]|nr:hypothetical protein [Methanoregula sp. UBA64]